MKRNNPDMNTKPGPLRDGWSKVVKYIHQNMLLLSIAIAVKHLHC